jgi:hypothetical protein
MLARKEDHRAVFRQPVAWLGESSVVFPQLFGTGADVKIALRIEDEVAAVEGSVRALGLVDQFHMRLDPALLHEPPDHIGRAVAPIGDHARQGEVELFSRSVEHGFGRANFRLANGCRRLDIHNHCMLQIDEIVVGVGITGDRVGPKRCSGRRIGWRIRDGDQRLSEDCCVCIAEFSSAPNAKIQDFHFSPSSVALCHGGFTGEERGCLAK